MTPEPRDQDVLVYGVPYAVTRAEIAHLDDLALVGRNAEAMALARTIVTRDTVCEPSNWYRCPRHEPRGFRAEPCPPEPEPESFRVPVTTDVRLPNNVALIGSPGKPARVLMAPAGTDPTGEGWHDVGTLAEPVEWSFGSRGDHAPVTPIRYHDDYSLSLTIKRPRPQDVPAVAPLDVFDLIYGETPRSAAHRAALETLSAACHATYVADAPELARTAGWITR